MAIEYRLTLAGNTPIEQVAQRALPDPAERPEPVERPTGAPPLLDADLYDRYGFDLTIRAGRNGYYEVESDDGSWEWEPEDYVDVTFRMGKEFDLNQAVINMLTIIRRILDTGSEDAALILNGDVLLFTRFDGILVKHDRQAWWDHYSTTHDIIPG